MSVKSDATDNVKSSIVNAGEVVVSRYEKDATISYDGKIIPSTGLDLSAQDLNTPKVFDLTKVSVKGGNADLKYTVSYTNGKGEAVSAEDTKLPGKYTATITVQDDTCTYGGSATVTFRVKATIIDVKDVYISYKGKVVDSTVADIYSGEDLLKNVSVKAFDVNGNEVPSSEYVVKVVNTESGKTVDEVVNKGNYKISVETKKGSMYKVDGAANFVILTVDPVTIASTGSNADIMLSGQDKLANGSKVYSFTGKEIIPTFEYDLKTGEYAADEDWKALPASSYRLTFKKDGKTVDSMVEAGIYTVILTDSSKDDNYVVDHTFNNVEVHAYVSFGDVKAGEWYAKPVYQAKVLGYVNGLRNADLFAPTKTITRGDVACILFNMAGGDDIYEGSKNELGGFDTGFNDVNPNMYYAKAIQWAESIDVVNGYGDGSFAPDKLVSREEFACMLANFSKAMHDFEAADSSVLDAFDDANEVDSWAKESVAWAVANKIMGNSGEINADDSILRAEDAVVSVDLTAVAHDLVCDRPCHGFLGPGVDLVSIVEGVEDAGVGSLEVVHRLGEVGEHAGELLAGDELVGSEGAVAVAVDYVNGLGPLDGLSVVHVRIDVVEAGVEPAELVLAALVDVVAAGHVEQDAGDVATGDGLSRGEQICVAQAVDVAEHLSLVNGLGIPLAGLHVTEGDVGVNLHVVEGMVDNVVIVLAAVGQDDGVDAGLDHGVNGLAVLLEGEPVGRGGKGLPVLISCVLAGFEVVLEGRDDLLAGETVYLGAVGELILAGEHDIGVRACGGDGHGVHGENHEVGSAVDLVHRALLGLDGDLVVALVDDLVHRLARLSVNDLDNVLAGGNLVAVHVEGLDADVLQQVLSAVDVGNGAVDNLALVGDVDVLDIDDGGLHAERDGRAAAVGAGIVLHGDGGGVLAGKLGVLGAHCLALAVGVGDGVLEIGIAALDGDLGEVEHLRGVEILGAQVEAGGRNDLAVIGDGRVLLVTGDHDLAGVDDAGLHVVGRVALNAHLVGVGALLGGIGRLQAVGGGDELKAEVVEDDAGGTAVDARDARGESAAPSLPETWFRTISALERSMALMVKGTSTTEPSKSPLPVRRTTYSPAYRGASELVAPFLNTFAL